MHLFTVCYTYLYHNQHLCWLYHIDILLDPYSSCLHTIYNHDCPLWFYVGLFCTCNSRYSFWCLLCLWQMCLLAAIAEDCFGLCYVMYCMVSLPAYLLLELVKKLVTSVKLMEKGRVRQRVWFYRSVIFDVFQNHERKLKHSLQLTNRKAVGPHNMVHYHPKFNIAWCQLHILYRLRLKIWSKLKLTKIYNNIKYVC